MALVVKQWYAEPTPNANGDYIHIVGREAGLIGWILSYLKIDPTTEVKINDSIIEFTQSSLQGRITRVIPLRAVSSSYYQFEKPLYKAIGLTISLLPVILVGLIVGPLYYFLNKKLVLGFVEISGWSGLLSFKRSIIEGNVLGETEAYQVINIVRDLVINKTS